MSFNLSPPHMINRPIYWNGICAVGTANRAIGQQRMNSLKLVDNLADLIPKQLCYSMMFREWTASTCADIEC